jgi:hypothetical protein
MAASKYSLSLGATRTCETVEPSVVPPRAASTRASYMPFSVGAKLPRYSPLRSPVHCNGTSMTIPFGPVMWALTPASFTSRNPGSETSAMRVTVSPDST